MKQEQGSDRNRITVQQLRYGRDNFSYLITSGREAAVVDGGAAGELLKTLKAQDCKLRWILNTHDHSDHTCGNDHLANKTGAPILKPQELAAMGRVPLERDLLTSFPTPGHTADSICIQAANFLFSGDTLFNGTVGNCFSGDLHAFFHSIERLQAFPPATIIMAGHDYVQDSVAFARRIEPDNQELQQYLREYEAQQVVATTLAQEKKVNPFLRYNDEDMMRLLARRELPRESAYARFCSLMTIS